jgi:hypothetical protein
MQRVCNGRSSSHRWRPAWACQNDLREHCPPQAVCGAVSRVVDPAAESWRQLRWCHALRVRGPTRQPAADGRNVRPPPPRAELNRSSGEAWVIEGRKGRAYPVLSRSSGPYGELGEACLALLRLTGISPPRSRIPDYSRPAVSLVSKEMRLSGTNHANRLQPFALSKRRRTIRRRSRVVGRALARWPIEARRSLGEGRRDAPFGSPTRERAICGPRSWLTRVRGRRAPTHPAVDALPRRRLHFDKVASRSIPPTRYHR